MSFYGTTAAADSYHNARGNTAWAAYDDTKKQAALTNGSDYVDRYADQFPGTKTDGRSQERQWPRTNAEDTNGDVIADDEVPLEVEQATYEAALLWGKGVSLNAALPSTGGEVIRKKVKGGPAEVETEYAAGTASTSAPSFSRIDDLLSSLLTGATGGAMLELLRG